MPANGKFRRAFFAYPGQFNDLKSPIEAAAAVINKSGPLEITIWPQLDIFGANIADTVRSGLADAEILVCDVTCPNMNVYYEVGFAIGQGKAVAPILNTSFANCADEIQRDGFFDNIGYHQYENTGHLIDILKDYPNTRLLDLYAKSPNLQISNSLSSFWIHYARQTSAMPLSLL